MNRHLAELIDMHPALEPCLGDIERAFHMIRDSCRAGGKLLLCGNGGSAADAEHWAGELLKGFERLRPLDAASRAKLPTALADSLQQALPAIPLTGFPSFATAFANDVRADLVFAQLVWALGRREDVLVGITTSGNSPNVCAAIEAANALGLGTIGLAGQSGGRVASLADVTIKAPSGRTCRVQEYHLPIYHCICLMLEDEFFGAPLPA